MRPRSSQPEIRPARLRTGFALAALLLAAPAALAHDFWIEPSTFTPSVGPVHAARLLIGHPGAAEGYGRNPAHVAEFALVGPLAAPPAAAERSEPASSSSIGAAGSARERAGDEADAPERRAVPGRDGADPAGLVRLPSEGRYVLVYRSNPSTVEMEPADFEDYLREKGLEGVIAQRRELGESDEPGREAFSRCAKALVTTANAPAGARAPCDTAVGLPLELVLLDDPHFRTAASLRVRLDRAGEPLAGALLHVESLAREPGAERETLSAWTDDAGVARLPLDAGEWLVTAVHAVRAAEGSAQQWRSRWASLAFAATARPSSDSSEEGR